MNHFLIIMVLLLIFLLIIVTVTRLNLQKKIAARIGNDGTNNVKIRVPLKYLSNFWRALEISLINCENNLVLTRNDKCYIIDNPTDHQKPTFTKTDTKFILQSNFI